MNEQPLDNPQNNLEPNQKSAGWFKYLVGILSLIIVGMVVLVIYLLPNHNLASILSRTSQNSSQQKPSENQQAKKQPDQQEPVDESLVRVDWLPVWLSLPALPSDKDQGTTRVKAGVVASGKYKGQDLGIEIMEGLGSSYRHYVMDGGKVVYFDELQLKIKGIDDLPDSIAMPGTGYSLKKNWVSSPKFSEIKKVRKLFTDPKLGDFYLTDTGCFVVELPNHTAVTYDFVIPFINKDTRELQMKFSDQSANADPYTITRITGCGALCMTLAFVEESTLQPQTRLMEAGKTNNGETIYQLKDSNDKALKDLYNDKNTVAYYNTTGGNYDQLPQNKYTYAQFVALHPLLYWKDPLGRWVELKNDKLQTAAEMCKPVIYLYPQKDTKMSVWVNPNGGFSYTNPEYNGGWNVVAHPDGTVTNLADRQAYPYLFWEGVGLNYPKQESGFVVARNKLESFLSEKLSALGLRGREIEDFKAYWVPRLMGLNKPYYKISFLKKEQMDELAPLEISVKPTSVIRVMMTAKGLDANEGFALQELPKPVERSSFTVVEWGGTVLK